MRSRRSPLGAESVTGKRVQSLSMADEKLVFPHMVKHMRRRKRKDFISHLKQNARANVMDRLHAFVQRVDRSYRIVFCCC